MDDDTEILLKLMADPTLSQRTSNISKLVADALITLGRTGALLRMASMEANDLELARALWRTSYATEALALPIRDLAVKENEDTVAV